MKIEFFHDVICSFCFPMSYRMRKIKEQMPHIEIQHRSFALAQEEHDFDAMFGSRTRAKTEILHHWEQANQNDDLHRFNITGMRESEFLFPTSMPGLLACKAAGMLGGDEAYWDVFDALQHALFVDNKNIEEQDVIETCIKKTDVDFDAWHNMVASKEVEQAVEADVQLAKQYQIMSVPTLLVNGKYRVNGAQSMDIILETLQKISSVEQLEEPSIGASCKLVDGNIICN